VRGALGEYVKKHGMDAAQKNGPTIIGVRSGKIIAKIEACPDDQEVLGEVIPGINSISFFVPEMHPQLRQQEMRALCRR
jgi:hypothetical protein